MNTLPRAVTAQIFSSPDSYNALRIHWSRLMNSEQKHALSSAHHLLYLALRGKDWRKAYTCASNEHKLANGAFVGWVLFRDLGLLHSKTREVELLAPFDGLATPAMLQTLRRFVLVRNAYVLHPEQFANGAFPFEAYVQPDGN